MGSRRGCQAHRDSSGGMRCNRCGFVWDYDDQEPPECLTAQEIAHGGIARALSDQEDKPEPILLDSIVMSDMKDRFDIAVNFRNNRYEAVRIHRENDPHQVAQLLRLLADNVDRNIK